MWKYPRPYSSGRCTKYLLNTCDKVGIVCPPPQTNARLIDELVGHLIEPQCINPTFITIHWLCLLWLK